MFKDFDNSLFQFYRTYVIPQEHVGRPDLISYEIYGNVSFYPAICKYNNITIPYRVRYRLRPRSIEKNLDDRFSTTTIEPTDEWQSYYNEWEGIANDLFLGRKILIPTIQSAKRYTTEYYGII